MSRKNKRIVPKLWTEAQTQALLEELKPKTKNFMWQYTDSRSNLILDDSRMRINPRPKS